MDTAMTANTREKKMDKLDTEIMTLQDTDGGHNVITNLGRLGMMWLSSNGVWRITANDLAEEHELRAVAFRLEVEDWYSDANSPEEALEDLAECLSAFEDTGPPDWTATGRVEESLYTTAVQFRHSSAAMHHCASSGDSLPAVNQLERPDWAFDEELNQKLRRRKPREIVGAELEAIAKSKGLEVATPEEIRADRIQFQRDFIMRGRDEKALHQTANGKKTVAQMDESEVNDVFERRKKKMLDAWSPDPERGRDERCETDEHPKLQFAPGSNDPVARRGLFVDREENAVDHGALVFWGGDSGPRHANRTCAETFQDHDAQRFSEPRPSATEVDKMVHETSKREMERYRMAQKTKYVVGQRYLVEGDPWADVKAVFRLEGRKWVGVTNVGIGNGSEWFKAAGVTDEEAEILDAQAQVLFGEHEFLLCALEGWNPQGVQASASSSFAHWDERAQRAVFTKPDVFLDEVRLGRAVAPPGFGPENAEPDFPRRIGPPRTRDRFCERTEAALARWIR